MKNTGIVITLGLCCVVAVGLIIFFFVGCNSSWCSSALVRPLSVIKNKPTAHSFEECMALGNPVTESYPRRCSSGKFTFIEGTEQSPASSPVDLEHMQPNQLVVSPLKVTGKALGSWFFEANIGLRLLDANGAEVAASHGQAAADWMTNELVPFAGTITFVAPATDNGFIEVAKDNPSGLLENSAFVRFPIKFR